jgi:hypothetical protein
VIRTASYQPDPALVTALVEADRRTHGAGLEVVEVVDPAP